MKRRERKLIQVELKLDILKNNKSKEKRSQKIDMK